MRYIRYCAVALLPLSLLLAILARGGAGGRRADAAASAAAARFQTPPGFVVEPAAPPERTGSIAAFTFDSFGRPVVAKENRYPTLLIDQNKDGVYDTERILTTKVHSLQGLWFDGRTLYAVGNNQEGQCGLYRLEDRNGDDELDTIEQLSRFEGAMGEHGPHDIRRGPDGAPTILLGNHTGVPADAVDPMSPLRDLKEWQVLDRYMDARGHAAGILAPGGTLVRWNEEKRNFTLLAGGLRNAYSHAYNLDGEAFTFDSDMEWDLNLPWYREVRSIHVAPGGDYGWRTGSGKFPAYFVDSLPPMRDFGRGSPVGVEFYQHHVYPRSYRDAFLEGDWSRGRILISNLVQNGATYDAAATVAGATEFVHGEPLNVTDIEVGPDGFVYFSTGGRDTEGGLYRVRYVESFWERTFREPEAESEALAAARQPQPLSSWGHAALARRKELSGPRWGEDLEGLALDQKAEAADRAQAILLLQRFGPKPKADLLKKLIDDRDARVRAAAVYVVGLHGSARAKALAAGALKDADALVRRRAAEAVVRMGLAPDDEEFSASADLTNDLYRLLGDADRFVRYAARLGLERVGREEWRTRVLAERDARVMLEGTLALLRTAATDEATMGEDVSPVFENLMAALRNTALARDVRLAALRLIGIAGLEWQAAAGPSLRKQVSDILLPQFVSERDEAMRRELARVIAWAGQPEVIQAILNAMPKGDANQPLQVHYVYCLRAIKDGWSEEQKEVLVRWFRKAADWRGGASFTGFVNLMFDSALESFFTEDERKLAWRRVPKFAPPDLEAGGKRPASIERTRGGGGSAAVSAQEIYEFVIFDPTVLKARPEKGRTLYEKECASCHRFGKLGTDFGPDLSSLKSRFKRKDVIEAILWPSKKVSDQYGSVLVETKDGGPINALVVREDAESLVLKTATEVRPVVVPKSRVTGRRKSDRSIMPDGLLDAYGQDEIANLIAFLEAGPEYSIGK